MKKNELVKFTGPANELEECEQSIHDAEKALFESGFQIAIILEKIKTQSLFTKVGIKTWEEYCRSDRLQYNKSHANQMIQSLRYRRVLPDPAAVAAGFAWTENNVRPLTRLSSPTVAKHCAAAAVKAYKTEATASKKEGEKQRSFLAVLKDQVAKAKDTLKERRARQVKAAKKLSEAKPANVIKGLERKARQSLVRLQTFGDDFWTAVEEEAPGSAVRAAQELEKLAAFLRS